MNILRTIISYPLLIFLFFCPEAFSQSSGIDQFLWMEGRWEAKSGDMVFYETWKKEDNQSMTGRAYYIQDADTVIAERMMIREIYGYWIFIAFQESNPPVMFVLAESGTGTWVFENKEHDYPQWVVYSRKEDGTILAWIEGNLNGEFTKKEFPMRKME